MNMVAGQFARARTLWRRRQAARRLGIQFNGARSFRLPSKIRMHGKEVALDLPRESGQVTAFVEILLDDCYCLGQAAASGRVGSVLDIGANAGLFCLAARHAFPGCRIHAYEPNRALCPDLARLAGTVGFDVHNEAVGWEAGRVTLALEAGQSLMSSTVADPEGDTPQISFRSAIERLGGAVDLVKLDCEGAEWEILEDWESWSKVRLLTMEYHLDAGDTHERVFGALDCIGFRVRHWHPVSSYGLVFAERAG